MEFLYLVERDQGSRIKDQGSGRKKNALDSKRKSLQRLLSACGKVATEYQGECHRKFAKQKSKEKGTPLVDPLQLAGSEFTFLSGRISSNK